MHYFLIGSEKDMKKVKANPLYFSLLEIVIMVVSTALIIFSFLIFDGTDYLNLFTSILGVVSLIFCAKGNPVGQILIIIFGCIYAYISFSFSYYGEMITYAGMTVPMAVLSLISWLKNPHNGNRSEVEVSSLSKKEIPFMLALSLAVTAGMYFVLKAFGTANLFISTVSVLTSFIAVYLTFRRSPYYALAYAANDVVLVVLWVLASFENSSYVSVATCFGVFLINDIYGFINWKRIQKRQSSE